MLYRLGSFIFWVYFQLFYKVKMYGHDNIPEADGIIICSNHINWLDPPLLGAYIKREINYMAKAELFKNKFISKILKAVNAFPVKRGTADISSFKNSLKLIKDGKVLGIFPEGTRSKDGNLKPAEPGVALIALKANAPVVPIRIIGNYKLFSQLKIIIGKPILFKELQGVKLSGDQVNELSQSIMTEIGKLS